MASVRPLAGWLGQVVAWLVMLVVAALVGVAVVVPRLAGATPYTVLTGSMRPELPPGTLVVVRPVEVSELGVGDVITYQLVSGDPTVVTHRVVAQGLDAGGEPILRTQGDANSVPDEEWVRPVQVRGRVWYSVPYLGRVSNVVGSDARQWAVYGVAAVLLGYAGYAFAGALRDRRRRTSGGTAFDSVPDGTETPAESVDREPTDAQPQEQA